MAQYALAPGLALHAAPLDASGDRRGQLVCALDSLIAQRNLAAHNLGLDCICDRTRVDAKRSLDYLAC